MLSLAKLVVFGGFLAGNIHFTNAQEAIGKRVANDVKQQWGEKLAVFSFLICRDWEEIGFLRGCRDGDNAVAETKRGKIMRTKRRSPVGHPSTACPIGVVAPHWVATTRIHEATTHLVSESRKL